MSLFWCLALIVPTSRRRTVCVGMPHRTLCVRFWDAERPGLHSHAERGNDRGLNAIRFLQPTQLPE
ncbi:hypothetical protein FQ185_00255 [Pseudomonas sp. ANT_H12B]|nr:hypothetical protein FQ185_00255 [Pseudomonas sp. ANT_H12B]